MVGRVYVNGKYPTRIVIGGRDATAMFKNKTKVWKFPARTAWEYPYANQLPAGAVWSDDLHGYTLNGKLISEVNQSFKERVIITEVLFNYIYGVHWDKSSNDGGGANAGYYYTQRLIIRTDTPNTTILIKGMTIGHYNSQSGTLFSKVTTDKNGYARVDLLRKDINNIKSYTGITYNRYIKIYNNGDETYVSIPNAEQYNQHDHDNNDVDSYYYSIIKKYNISSS